MQIMQPRWENELRKYIAHYKKYQPGLRRRRRRPLIEKTHRHHREYRHAEKACRLLQIVVKPSAEMHDQWSEINTPHYHRHLEYPRPTKNSLLIRPPTTPLQPGLV